MASCTVGLPISHPFVNRNGTPATGSVDSSVFLCLSFPFTPSQVWFPTRTQR